MSFNEGDRRSQYYFIDQDRVDGPPALIREPYDLSFARFRPGFKPSGLEQTRRLTPVKPMDMQEGIEIQL